MIVVFVASSSPGKSIEEIVSECSKNNIAAIARPSWHGASHDVDVEVLLRCDAVISWYILPDYLEGVCLAHKIPDVQEMSDLEKIKNMPQVRGRSKRAVFR